MCNVNTTPCRSSSPPAGASLTHGRGWGLLSLQLSSHVSPCALPVRLSAYLVCPMSVPRHPCPSNLPPIPLPGPSLPFHVPPMSLPCPSLSSHVPVLSCPSPFRSMYLPSPPLSAPYPPSFLPLACLYLPLTSPPALSHLLSCFLPFFTHPIRHSIDLSHRHSPTLLCPVT